MPLKRTSMTPPHLAVVHTTSIPEALLSDFMQLVAAEKLDLRMESREEDGPFAVIEWLIPTAVIVYISKSYFDAFLKEMGKDHYALLKAGLRTLCGKLVGPPAPKVMIIATKGKVRGDHTYSLLLSVLAEAGDGLILKLLLRTDVPSDEHDRVLATFLAFLEDYHDGTLDRRSVERLKRARVVGRTILVAFNSESETIEPVDPFTESQNDEA